MGKKKYTVILIYPDHVAETYGDDFYTGLVRASDPVEALDLARSDALKANGLTREDCEPVDFACVACYSGWLLDLNPEAW